MKVKWEAQCVKMIPKAIGDEKLNQRIAEVSEIIYDLFCQLERSDLLLEPIETEISPGNFMLLEQRTGTHG